MTPFIFFTITCFFYFYVYFSHPYSTKTLLCYLGAGLCGYIC